ncbi:ATP-binding cassette domain-containing protein [Desulforhopalus vacuolatus]|uniref:ABC transporter ATP-binding protein n=1 Tax=Desulforhopalus vacuolatus TaxID=40414 RepID=UPI0019665F62|nr:ATP-binding cassette domain-containing protein [Desulforhopalus vacuolatus]MBM9521161.1 ATP-binding cassette domain-containing protein [Desulforhopalus vacuolatus]
MIEIDLLTFGYGAGHPGSQQSESVYQDFSLTIGRGEAWSIIGPSGCGKSTLLLLLAGLNRSLSGRIIIDGEEIVRPRPRTGLVLQDHGLLPWATVAENTRLGLKIRHFYGPDGRHSPLEMETDPVKCEARVQYWLEWLGIAALQEKYPSQLSRGQRQRAAIARTLVLEPDLLLLDEPFSALDAPIREELQRVMAGFHEESGLTSITVTHDIEEATLTGEKILVLTAGENRSAHVLDNEFAGAFERRSEVPFLERCAELRLLLGGVPAEERT